MNGNGMTIKGHAICYEWSGYLVLRDMDWSDGLDISNLIIEEAGGLPLLRVEESLVMELRNIEKLMRDVEASQEGLLFSCVSGRDGVRVETGRLGNYFVSKLNRGRLIFREYFPFHDINPYVEVFFKCVEKVESSILFRRWMSFRDDDAKSFSRVMNDLIAFVRQELSSNEFKAVVNRFGKASAKRADSLDRYIDALFEKHSRMLVVRVDLSYQSGFLTGRNNFYADVKLVKLHWSRLQRDLHKGKPVNDLLGFACKLEYGQMKGFHLHLLLFYNGSLHRQDGVLARMVGEYWRDIVTGGRGRYFNCNAVKKKYRHLGIGAISFDQPEKIYALKNKVASYLTKVDYWVRLSAESGRTFFRGNMPKLKAVKRGRPRGCYSAQKVLGLSVP